MADVRRKDPMHLDFARSMRREATPAERRMWSLLRNRQIAGFKFRRQYLVAGFILDFYCPSASLAVEIDGDHHGWDDRERHDRARSAELRRRGIRVLLFSNGDVLDRFEGVAETILHALTG